MKKNKIVLLALSATFLTTGINGVISANKASSTKSSNVENPAFFKGVKNPESNQKEQQKSNAQTLYNFYTKKMKFTKEGAIGAIAVAYHESNLINNAQSKTGNIGLYAFTGKVKEELQKSNPANSTLITNQINLIQKQLEQDKKSKTGNNYVEKLQHSKSFIKSAELFNKGFEKAPTTNKVQMQKAIKQVKQLLK